MTTRLLPREEWHKLSGTELSAAWPLLTDGAQVIVVEEDDAIVGCWALIPVIHAEGLFIAPGHRKRVAVARRLWDAMRLTATRTFKVDAVMTGACSDDVRKLLEHVGATKLAGDHYTVPVTRG